ncbi:NAD(P)H-binding protein [Streptomyces sp. A7024]|uniref:NAD(P)H-binding protein n=1 Tax=Streptomyces coryli TaxID=1128680 RepID=A0A6G4TXX6_9ACTN|nr:NAD(P)H-binding protein [Streptomyces coryli]NGN63851.1 NAD(P)H-binding protein [Streptomyces coryli]
MKLTVFGATGGVGREVVRQALDAGHEVTAVVRDATRLGVPEHPRLGVVEVRDVTDAEVLTEFVAGRDAVISAIGAPSNAAAKAAPIAGPALRAITTAMAAAGVRRLAAVSAAPVGPVPEGEGVFTRGVVLPIVRWAFRYAYVDLADMERVLAASDTDWTVVRPPQLTDKARTGAYRSVIGGNVRGGRSISRADVADALLAAVADPATVGRAVGVAA